MDRLASIKKLVHRLLTFVELVSFLRAGERAGSVSDGGSHRNGRKSSTIVSTITTHYGNHGIIESSFCVTFLSFSRA